MLKKITTVLLLGVATVIPALADSMAPLEAAVKTNNYFMEKYADPTEPTNVKRIRPSNLWTRAVYYEGLMALNDVAPEQRYLDYTDKWAGFHGWTPRNGITTTHADDQCCSQTYLDRYMVLKDTTCMVNVGRNLDHQMNSGRDDYWTWIDAIQMAMPVYSKYYKITGNRRYMDYAINSYKWSRDTCGGGLFNTAEGLWWRDKDYVPPYKEKDGNNCYWSRGNGWVYAALVRVMNDLSPEDPYYQYLLKDFKAMSEALVKCQREDGYWNVSLVSPVTYGGPEMTGTALFLYGMCWGVMHGYLDEAVYRPVIDKAWKALEACVHPNGFLGYNQGTGKDPSAGQPVTFTSMPDFEDYGTGCFLLGATEYYKLLQKERSVSMAWPSVNTEAGPGTRWWWPGSAVDRDNLKWNLENLAGVGIKTVEITPIYGAIGNEKNDIKYLSPEWMQALKDVSEIASDLGMQVDMNNGTGWPFGGPTITEDIAACKAVFADTIVHGKLEEIKKLIPAVQGKDKTRARLQCVKQYPIGDSDDTWRVIALYTAPTMQKVKRAAPGGEGLVVDHFDRDAVARYLARFDSAFAASGAPVPATFFNDSYEVYKANWTPKLLEEFAKRRGYRLEDKFPELLGYIDDGNKVLADYRETLSDLLYENFTKQWADWAHSHGAQVRNQAHGSPANLLDLYAAVDIPEIEGFGLTDFGIKGLRKDPDHVRPNFSDVSMLKYASSAAHVAGKPLVSSETFTWLTEHFRTSLSQMKPDLDLMFTCGVNHAFYHGTCYSPREVAWPGWRFYASIDMSPNNTIWRDAPALNEYIARCQSFLQKGEPDNDFLVYLPIHDLWRKRHKDGVAGLMLSFDIHSMDKKAPEFIKSILKIDSLGWDCDYISDRQLANAILTVDGKIKTQGGTTYKGIVIPSGTTLTPELQQLLAPFEGHIVYGENAREMRRFAKPEDMRSIPGVRTIRRKNLTGHHYFIANLSGEDVNEYVPLAVNFRDAVWYDPMTGAIYKADIDDSKVRLNLKSGESRILVTSPAMLVAPQRLISHRPSTTIDLTDNKWTLSFVESNPNVKKTFKLKKVLPWENLSKQTRVLAGTGVYSTTVNLTPLLSQVRWILNLGDVRESARVYVNGKYVATAWAAPFEVDLGDALQSGDNEIRIEVTNLPANLIADYDRRGIDWRCMKEINVVGLDYKPANYANWDPVPSGLNSTVKLISY